MSEKYSNHPRTLINLDSMPVFREKMKRNPFRKMLDLSIETANAHACDKDWIADGRLMRAYSEIFLACGDPGYAQLAKQAFGLFVQDEKQVLSNPFAKGLTRAQYLFNLAQTYDFCASSWDDNTCESANNLLYRLIYELSASLGEGGNYRIANNWNGVRAGAIIYAAFACDNDNTRYLLWESRERLRDHLRANLSENGWNPEGIGYVTYPWIYMAPAIITAKNNGEDYLSDLPQAKLTYIASLFGIVPIESCNGYYGIHCDLSDDNTEFDSRGTLASSFAIADTEYHPAIKWMFDHLRGDNGDLTWDGGDYGLINSMLFYPEETEARNPSEILGLTYADPSHGILQTRNRFFDENDITALCCAASRRPGGTHNGCDTGAVRLVGLGNIWITGSGRTGNPDGQSILFPGDTDNTFKPAKADLLGRMTAYGQSHDGSGWAILEGSCVGTKNHIRKFAADYSKASGADALIVLSDSSDNGKRWRINTIETNHITVDSNGFTITAPDGASLRVVLFGIEEKALKNAKLGRFERGRAGDAAIVLREKSLCFNNWIEYSVDNQVTAVMTLVSAEKEHPDCRSADGILYIGEQTVRIVSDRFIFGK